MLVTFLDDDGNMYQWAPKWAEVEQVFLKQINVERFNKPESAFLNRFANTAQSVVEGAQRITSAYKLSGIFEKYDDECLLIRDGSVLRSCVPGFEITTAFLDVWLNQNVELLVINDIAFRVRSSWYESDAGLTRDEYPLPEN